MARNGARGKGKKLELAGTVRVSISLYLRGSVLRGATGERKRQTDTRNGRESVLPEARKPLSPFCVYISVILGRLECKISINNSC